MFKYIAIFLVSTLLILNFYNYQFIDAQGSVNIKGIGEAFLSFWYDINAYFDNVMYNIISFVENNFIERLKKEE